jgi:hypothetical protein
VAARRRAAELEVVPAVAEEVCPLDVPVEDDPDEEPDDDEPLPPEDDRPAGAGADSE